MVCPPNPIHQFLVLCGSSAACSGPFACPTRRPSGFSGGDRSEATVCYMASPSKSAFFFPLLCWPMHGGTSKATIQSSIPRPGWRQGLLRGVAEFEHGAINIGCIGQRDKYAAVAPARNRGGAERARLRARSRMSCVVSGLHLLLTSIPSSGTAPVGAAPGMCVLG